jgi:hypothetical protein
MAQVGQNTLNPVIAPGGILLGNMNTKSQISWDSAGRPGFFRRRLL